MADPSPAGSAKAPVKWGRLFRPDLSAETLRAVVNARPPRPYEMLEMTPMVAEPALLSKCRKIIAEGWTSAGVTIELTPPMPWTSLARSAAFDLNSWKPITRLLSGFSLMGERDLFDAAYAVIRDWVETFHPLTASIETPKQLDAFIGNQDDFVWYDMSVGVRCYRLAYALEVRARDQDVPDAELEQLAACLYFHMEALSRPDFFKGHNNHGLYQALGQLAAAQRFIELPKMREYAALASRRLEQMIREHFFESGVHNEHSPGYHYMLLGTFVGARNSGVLQNFYFVQMLERMEEVLTWMLLPDSTTAPIGDTDVVSVWRRPALAEAYDNRELRYLLSGGKTGVEPRGGVRAYPDAGYAFARMKGADGGWGYMAQIAGFHSRMHKQADDLAFLWWDRGRNVLVDPGRYAFSGKTTKDTALFQDGFWYADPRRIHVETTRAHNTVGIDGRNFQRVGVKPYGSALVQAVENDGLAVFESFTTHFETVDHRRLLVMKPGEFLLAVDWLNDAAGVEHDFAQHFHLAPEWTAEAGPRGLLRAVVEGGPSLCALDLTGKATLGPILCGRTEPDLAGWVADKANSLVPAPAFAFNQRGASAVFATVFTFARDAKAPPGTSTIADKPPLRFNWIADGRRWTVGLRRGPNQEIVARLES